MAESSELTIGGGASLDTGLDLWLEKELSSEQWRWCNIGGATGSISGHVLAVAELVSSTAGASASSSWLWTRITSENTRVQIAGGPGLPGTVILEVNTISGWQSVSLEGPAPVRTTSLTGDPSWELFVDPAIDLLTITQAAYAIVAWMRGWEMPGLEFYEMYPAAPRRRP